MKSIAFLLFLIIITTLNPINVNASDSNDIIYEIVKRNPSLVITDAMKLMFIGNLIIENLILL